MVTGRNVVPGRPYCAGMEQRKRHATTDHTHVFWHDLAGIEGFDMDALESKLADAESHGFRLHQVVVGKGGSILYVMQR